MICYHGTPMTPEPDMKKCFDRRHAMVSYWEPRQVEVVAQICQSFVGDCGSFSAWIAKVEPNFGGYIEWVGVWRRHPSAEWFIIPDIIDGAEEENNAWLDRWPYPDALSVPVYHLHEPTRRLEMLIERYPRIALGSSGKFKEVGTDEWWGRMDEIMEVGCDAEGYPLRKYHGLRMLDSTVFSHVPLSSADSCNIARNVGIDTKWSGPYAPRSRAMRALIMMDRIESHASATRWCKSSAGVRQNLELFG